MEIITLYAENYTRHTNVRFRKKMQGVLCQKLARVLTILQHNIGKRCVIPLYVKRYSIDIVLKFQT